jgi:hypothetical protein
LCPWVCQSSISNSTPMWPRDRRQMNRGIGRATNGRIHHDGAQEDPPFFNQDPGYTNGFTIGRLIQLGISKRF